MCDYCEKAKLIKPSDGYFGLLYDPEEKQRHARICRGRENAIYFVAEGNRTYFNIRYCPFCGKELEQEIIGMDVEEINKYIIEEMGYAEEQEVHVTIRLNLSNDDCIEVWFDKENDLYTWSNASFGYEDIYAVVSDITKWLSNNSLLVTDMETI